MKAGILTLLGISLFFNLFSQSQKSFDFRPKGMSFVPRGSFVMKVIENKDTVKATVSVDAFWMSNEITNSEYREYVNDVKQHPDGHLYWIDYEKAVKDKNLSKTKEGMQKYTMSLKYSEIVRDIIDVTKLPYSDYFTNKKYDKYPVVAVSQRQATFFCTWKTKRENDKFKKLGKPTVHDYRLPTEAEWAYVAAQPQTGKAKNGQQNVINPSKSNVSNSWGLCNFSGNVSEWTSSNPKMQLSQADPNNTQQNLKVVRGGSWRTNPDIEERKIVEQNTKEDYIGFRIVRSVLAKK